MSIVKSSLVERSKGDVMTTTEGDAKSGGKGEPQTEGEVAKIVYWGVGKRGLGIIRGGGEARVGFA